MGLNGERSFAGRWAPPWSIRRLNLQLPGVKMELGAQAQTSDSRRGLCDVLALISALIGRRAVSECYSLVGSVA